MQLQDTDTGSDIPLPPYDRVLIAFSGGKDSLACIKAVLDAGISRDRIELWHHDVDGQEGSELMDWPCTRAYCKAVADHLGIPLYYSWKEGGFEREMLRDGTRTAPIRFETPEGTTETVGGTRGKLGTRRRYPQVSADLRVRWCSGYLKIDVMSAAITNQERFQGMRTLVVTGERGQESAARSRYSMFEPHRTDRRNGKRVQRHVDHWRPVLHWQEIQVWSAMRNMGIVPHPAYQLGWGRVSCAACIFGSADQWASLKVVLPEMFERIASYEDEFGTTIHRSRSIREQAERGRPYRSLTPERITSARSRIWDGPIAVDPALWESPAGAFGESTGPS